MWNNVNITRDNAIPSPVPVPRNSIATHHVKSLMSPNYLWKKSSVKSEHHSMRKFPELGAGLHQKLQFPVTRVFSAKTVTPARDDDPSCPKVFLGVQWGVEKPFNDILQSMRDLYTCNNDNVFVYQVSSPGDQEPSHCHGLQLVLYSVLGPHGIKEVIEAVNGARGCGGPMCVHTTGEFGQEIELEYGLAVPPGNEPFPPGGGFPFDPSELEQSGHMLEEWEFARYTPESSDYSDEPDMIPHFGPTSSLQSRVPIEDLSLCDPWAFVRLNFGISSLKRIDEMRMPNVHEIVIPDSVEEICDDCFAHCHQMYRIAFGASSSLKRISRKAFLRCSCLKDIQIPDTVEEICDEGFSDCSQLACVMFGMSSSLKRIGIRAFMNAERLREFRIPDSVEELGDECFWGCKCLARVACGISPSLKFIGNACFGISGLQCFSVPASVVSIGSRAFLKCPIEGGLVFADNSRFVVQDSLVMDKDCRVCYGSVGRLWEVTIPPTVEEICAECFSEDQGPGGRYFDLVRVSFGAPSSLKRIGPKAFCKCHRLVEVQVIPDSVEEIGDGCFYQCDGLSSFAFSRHSSLRRIGADAFMWCGNLEELEIPDSVEEIDDTCFYRCRSLCTVTFSESSSLKRMGKGTFKESSLKEIQIPDGVEEICDECFLNCWNLSSVTFGKNSALKRIGDQAFCLCNTLPALQIPDSVEELGNMCCKRCNALRSVTIGEASQLKHVGSEAFASCRPQFHCPERLMGLFPANRARVQQKSKPKRTGERS